MPRKSDGWPSWQAVRKQEKFTALTNSVQNSRAHRSLTANQRDLLYLCWRLGNPKNRSKNAPRPCKDFPSIDAYKHENVFYMCINTAIAEGIYAPTNRKYYSDMKILEQHGFIKRLSKGNIGSMSIYKLSADWQKYQG